MAKVNLAASRHDCENVKPGIFALKICSLGAKLRRILYKLLPVEIVMLLHGLCTFYISAFIMSCWCFLQFHDEQLTDIVAKKTKKKKKN